MAVPVVVQTAKNNDPGTPTSLTATFGATPTPGNVLVAAVTSEIGYRATSISGWRLHKRQQGAVGSNLSFFTKVAGAAEPTAVTSTFNGNSRTAMVIFEISGADPESPVEWGERTATTGTAQAGASVTPITGLDVLLIQINAANNAQGITVQPSGYTQINEEVVNDGTSHRLTAWYKGVVSPSGLQTGATTTYAGNVNFNAVQVAIHAPQAASALARRSYTQFANTGAGNVTSAPVTISAPLEGSTLVASFLSMTSGAPTFPAGWTTLMSNVDTGGGIYFSLAVKEAGASEPTSITVTFSSRNTATLTVSEITGRYVDFASSPTAAAINPGTNSLIPVPNRAGLSAHGLLFFTGWANGQIIGNVPAGFFDHREVFSGGTPSTMTESGFRAIRDTGTTVTAAIYPGQAAVTGAHRVMLLFVPGSASESIARRPNTGANAVIGAGSGVPPFLLQRPFGLADSHGRPEFAAIGTAAPAATGRRRLGVVLIQ